MVASLKCVKRELKNTSHMKQLRKDGFVPAVIHKKGTKVENVSIESVDLQALYETGYIKSTVINLDYNSKEVRVIVYDYHTHPVSGKIIHVDFKVITKSEYFITDVVIRFKNKSMSPGIKRGAKLNKIKRSLKIKTKADSLPKEVIVDLSKLNIGDNIKISDCSFEKDVHPLDKVDTVIVATKGKGKLKEEEAS